MLAGRHIVLGVTGGVAAYKAAYIARLLIESGAEVRTVMTPTARRFVGVATFGALTGSDPIVDLFGGDDISPHTTLARWADAIVIAPTTASTLAKLATGESSNALVATVLASNVPVVIAPAMHTEMWEHIATQDNVTRLKSFGYHIVPPQTGALAGGDVGIGRLAEPDDVVAALSALFEDGDLSGMTVLITAGGTREPVDAVRYIGNRSSGKMGNALAQVAAARGAKVTLVTAAPPPDSAPELSVIEVETAAEMADAVWSRAGDSDIAVMAAAVADFRPKDPTEGKIRRSDGAPVIDLEPTPDVLEGVGEVDARPFIVGFAAEVGSLDAAISKAQRKGVDLLVANDVARPGSGFGSDTNEVTLITPDGGTTALPLMSKLEVATAIWDAVIEQRGQS